MAQARHTINIADIPALRPIAEEVVRTRQRQRLPVDGEDVTLIIAPSPRGRRLKKELPARSDDSFLASYQAVAPLRRQLSVEEMTEIAAEEHAQEAAGTGL